MHVLNAAPRELSRDYDNIFARYGNRLPVPFLRALAYRESNFNPKETDGSYWGILQVGWRPTPRGAAEGKDDSVMGSYNRRRGTHYTREDLLNPVVNVKIASELIRRIIKSYAKNHPRVPNMKEDWSNPEFVRLVVAGWNSGYSEGGGVGKVADYLEAHNIPVTHANVFRYSQAAGATKHLANDTKENWQRSVVNTFYAQPDAFEAFHPRQVAFVAPFPVVWPWQPGALFAGAERAGTVGGAGLGAAGAETLTWILVMGLLGIGGTVLYLQESGRLRRD